MLTASLLTLFSLVGAAQGLVLGFSILSFGRRARAADRLLAGMLMVAALTISAVALSHAVGAHGRYFLELAEYALWWAFGPLTYVYIHRITGGRLTLPLALHFLPAVAWVLYVAVALATGPGPRFPAVLALMAYQALYTALAIQRLVDRWSPEQPSGVHRFWSVAWAVLLVAMHAAQAVRYLFRDVGWLEDVVPLVAAAGFVALTFLGFRRSGLLAAEVGAKRGRRYLGSSLASGRAEEIAARVRQSMDDDRRYLEGDLTLDSLAEELDVPRTHLSQAINQCLGVSFLEMVNRHRVTEAGRLLRDPGSQHLTIEAIAYRSGFASRSAFYEAFRKETGKTPSTYRDQAGEPG